MTIYFIIQLSIIIIFSTILSVQDSKSQLISNWLLILFGTCGFATNLIFNLHNWYLYLISTAVCFLFYFLIRLISKKKLGLGDLYFGIIQGLILLPQLLWICFAVETAGAIIFWICNKKRTLPFIPFMSIGLTAAFIFTLFL